jgi:hypothetical protein
MNVRLFLLFGMTALFAVIWSSDQQYQETQRTASHAVRQRLSELAPTVDEKTVVSIDVPASVPKSPLDPSSWIAPTFAVPPIEATPRHPIVAPVAVRHTLPVEEAGSPMISVIVSFQRPSFRLVGEPLGDDSQVAAGSHAVPHDSVDLAELSRLASRLRFEIQGQTCWLRWRMRRTALIARRRFMTQLARQREWCEVGEKIVLGALGAVDAPAKNAAAAPVGIAR